MLCPQRTHFAIYQIAGLTPSIPDSIRKYMVDAKKKACDAYK